mmetsp:Transcript_30578/g.79274  ORF Transcript_30578/g.79274 Transcript_30578/m.79274 type:complete len:348 (+) Transcript_30578:685-1728(+)
MDKFSSAFASTSISTGTMCPAAAAKYSGVAPVFGCVLLASPPCSRASCSRATSPFRAAVCTSMARSMFTISAWPACRAASMGVSPVWLATARLAPLAMRARTSGARPVRAACMSGADPSVGDLALTSAPARIKAFTTSAEAPTLTARCSKVTATPFTMPSWFTLTLGRPSKTCRISSDCAWTAKCKGKQPSASTALRSAAPSSKSFTVLTAVETEAATCKGLRPLELAAFTSALMANTTWTKSADSGLRQALCNIVSPPWRRWFTDAFTVSNRSTTGICALLSSAACSGVLPRLVSTTTEALYRKSCDETLTALCCARTAANSGVSPVFTAQDGSASPSRSTDTMRV